MHAQQFGPAAAEPGHARVAPEVASVAAMAAEFDVILMGLIADPEHAYEFMLGTVKRTLTGVGLGPDADVQHGAVRSAPRNNQVGKVTPVVAHVMHAAFGRDPCCIAQSSARRRRGASIAWLKKDRQFLAFLDLILIEQKRPVECHRTRQDAHSDWVNASPPSQELNATGRNPTFLSSGHLSRSHAEEIVTTPNIGDDKPRR